ncbi:hypothetical protein [Marinobacter sp.]|uniref:hypothetical protein n=1 Tax=Marinobacter sp. TaxID=50741 RepID=UPI00261FB1FF|nr:hypothetical protein [Marinobacter sp.]
MARQRLEEEYKGFRIVVHRIGSAGEHTAFAIRPNTKTRRLSAREFAGRGAKKSAYNEIRAMVDEATGPLTETLQE